MHVIYCYDFISNDLRTARYIHLHHFIRFASIRCDSIQFEGNKNHILYGQMNERPNGIHSNKEVCLCDGEEEKRKQFAEEFRSARAHGISRNHEM